MDVNGDGIKDIVTGSYCSKGDEEDDDVAGLLYQLKGLGKGEFAAPEVMKNTTGENLVISNEEMDERMCTRPFAADINGDNALDLIVGNQSGEFYQFKGAKEGFSPKSIRLVDSSNKPLKVPENGDPFLIDFDADGDLDLLSGSYEGGVFLSSNLGTSKKADFAPFQEIIPRTPQANERRGINPTTRICVADFNEDGLLDLIVGDQNISKGPPEGVSEEQAQTLKTAWEKENAKINAELQQHHAMKDKDTSHKKKLAALTRRQFFHQIKKRKFSTTKKVGFVWVYLQKNPASTNTGNGENETN